jgi:hypothetical protein
VIAVGRASAVLVDVLALAGCQQLEQISAPEAVCRAGSPRTIVLPNARPLAFVCTGKTPDIQEDSLPMKRFRSVAIAVTALALSAGAVFAFTDVPQQAVDALAAASGLAGRQLPAHPATLPEAADDHASGVDTLDVAADLPDAASHGSDVSAVATADDPTPDTNKGADVSAAAKDNAGQTKAAEHRPAAVPPVDTGAPEGAGKPDGAGMPADAGQPADPGAPDGAGKPDGVPPQH